MFSLSMSFPSQIRSLWLSLLCSLALLASTTPAAHAQADPPIPAGDIRVHYFRPDGNYADWTIYEFF